MRSARQAPAPKPPARMKRPPSIFDGPKKKAQKAKSACCPNPDLKSQDDGSLVCMSCFREIDAAPQIVSEVQFSEDAGGKATAQGSYINNDARHANTLGAGARRLGGNDRDAGQTASANAKRILNGLCPRLSLGENVKTQAVALYQLASGSNFSAGRRTEEVVAACLYAVCRRNPDNQVLLIDISELQRVNVFRLGEVYKALCKDVYLPQSSGKEGHNQRNIEIESLIMKYCRKLEFGDKTRQVAEDAVRILKRMKRDWIVTGRHPAGLCGACIIYAARMNNFRRTKREVVYVAKIADQTVAKRMMEFQRTRTAAMSVAEFRSKGHLVREAHDPPAFVKNREKEANEKAKKEKEKPKGPIPWSKKRRQAYEIKKARQAGKPIPVFPDDDDEQTPSNYSNAGATSTASRELVESQEDDDGPRKRQRMADGSPAPATPPATQQEPQLDEDGFAVPVVPASVMRQQQRSHSVQRGGSEVDIIDLDGEEEQRPKKRGRKPKEIWTPSAEELVAEGELEREMQAILARESENDGLRDAQARLDEDRAKEREEEERRRQNGEFNPEEEKEKERQRERERAEASRHDALGYDVNDWQRKDVHGNKIYDEVITAESLEEEFANDPEVMNCKLPEADQKIKEQIWVAENEDWMRVQVAKEINKRLNQENRKDKAASRKGAKPGRRKKGKMGDGSTIAEATTPIETPLDANHAMFERRGMPKGISKHINYEALKNAYKQRSSSSRDTSEAPTTREASVAPSEASTRETGSPTPAPEGDPQQASPTHRDTAAGANGATGLGSPPATQEQATAGAEQTQGEDDDGGGEDDANDYNEDELDYGGGSDEEGEARGGWLNPDDEEEGGGFDEDDEYGPMSRASLQPHGDEESFF